MGARVLVIDNYDSFVYNLVQYLGELGAEPVVHRHDALDLDALLALEPDAVLVSPGPGPPRGRRRVERGDPRSSASAGVPVLGVCLGHQCIGQLYGGDVVRAPARHARQDLGDHPRRQRACSPGCPTPFTATRYHSLVVERDSVPDVLEVTAESEDGLVMGLRHRELPDRGRAVPPRVDPHRLGPRPPRATSSPGLTASATVGLLRSEPTSRGAAVRAGGRCRA